MVCWSDVGQNGCQSPENEPFFSFVARICIFYVCFEPCLNCFPFPPVARTIWFDTTLLSHQFCIHGGCSCSFLFNGYEQLLVLCSNVNKLRAKTIGEAKHGRKSFPESVIFLRISGWKYKVVRHWRFGTQWDAHIPERCQEGAVLCFTAS